MQPVKVETNAQKRAFCNVSRKIYRNDPHWVCPLDDELESIFDPGKNDHFNNGEASRWILKNSRDEVLGRIAAFVDFSRAQTFEQPTGGVGFFECIDDKNAACSLFEKAKEWLKEQGMEAMDGPINFGSNYNYWGLLVEGFVRPAIGMNYHPPYYRKLFEAFGFEPLYEQYTNLLDLNRPFPSRFARIAEWACRKQNITACPLEMKKLDQFVEDFVTIYNQAWQHHKEFQPIEKDYIEKELSSLKALLEEKLVWFVYVNDQPAGFVITIPDYNELFKKFNGKLNLWKMLRFWYYKQRKKMTRARVLIMGVVPRFQKHGIESVLIQRLYSQKEHFPAMKEAELSWVGNFNKQMLALHKATGARLKHKHITFRKELKT